MNRFYPICVNLCNLWLNSYAFFRCSLEYYLMIFARLAQIFITRWFPYASESRDNHEKHEIYERGKSKILIHWFHIWAFICHSDLVPACRDRSCSHWSWCAIDFFFVPFVFFVVAFLWLRLCRARNSVAHLFYPKITTWTVLYSGMPWLVTRLAQAFGHFATTAFVSHHHLNPVYLKIEVAHPHADRGQIRADWHSAV